MDVPGLIERRLVKEHTPSTVEIEETWDVSVKGCPIIVVDLKTGNVNSEAVRVTRHVLMAKNEWTFG